MSWWEIIKRALELFGAFLAKVRGQEKANVPGRKTPPQPITKQSVDKQIKHQKELYKKNHPKG